MSSEELTGWSALFAVHTEEEEHRKDLAESGDGQVIVHGRDPEADDEDDEDEGEESDGQAE